MGEKAVPDIAIWKKALGCSVCGYTTMYRALDWRAPCPQCGRAGLQETTAKFHGYRKPHIAGPYWEWEVVESKPWPAWRLLVPIPLRGSAVMDFVFLVSASAAGLWVLMTVLEVGLGW